ncbi:MAG: hydrogenase nickel incorporation protein HypB [Zetaproteobacteria bacterium]|nr:hydrogenase nickel incorporation protein HypB [Zetaproteobacteria bacterium]
MCTTCGCAHGDTQVNGKGMTTMDDGHHHNHHSSGHTHHHDHDIQTRTIQMEQDILSKNSNYAAKNRSFFAQQGVLALNLVSSPGSGKTTLLTRTLTDLQGMFPMGVIEGDQQTRNDADRIAATGMPVVQINTGKGCHLDAHMVGHAITELNLDSQAILFIENVGNLVCPAAFDLGESYRVVILSVTEGEDKPLKYPDMFHSADVMLLNKVDLLPYLAFDLDLCIANARKVNPRLKILLVSATQADGMEGWYAWIKAMHQVAQL